MSGELSQLTYNLVPVGSLEAYIQYANSIPMLSHTEEIALANRLREDHDLNAAKGLILPHLRFVVRIARGYSGYGLLLNDLIQEGTIGLMKAVKREECHQCLSLHLQRGN